MCFLVTFVTNYQRSVVLIWHPVLVDKHRLQDVTLEEGSFLEPLSVAVHAVANIGTLRAGQNVAIFGAGPVGLLSMAVANALGARRVIGIDIQQDRLDFARSYAATDIWKSTPAKPDESMTDCARRQTFEMRDALGIDLETGPESMHLVIDCTGAEACITCGVFLVADAGTCVQVGIRSMNASLPSVPSLCLSGLC